MKKNVLKLILVCCLTLDCVTLTLAQPNQNIVPPSPVTREFTKYINQEVSLYNGIPEINIPLYNIQLKGVTIPINLSYHASGIKYAQEDGNVGVGWFLNPGYRVSRNIHGHADEIVAMPADMLSVLSSYEANAAGGNTPGKVVRDKYLAKFLPSSTFGYGMADGEFDQFTFSTPTASGGFIITDRTNKTVVTTEHSNLKFDYKTGGSVCSLMQGIKGLQITDETGNKYAFGEYNAQTQCTLETAAGMYGGTLATAWGISDITTPNGDAINFSYKRAEAGEFTTHRRFLSVAEGQGPGACDHETFADETYDTGNGYYTFAPTQIVSPNEIVTFFYSQDYYQQDKIVKVEIKSPTGVHLKSIKFFYSDGTHHTFLDRIEITDQNLAKVETYKFEYYAKNTTDVLTLDHYGNYKLTYNPNTFYHQEFLNDPVVISTSPGSCSMGLMSYFLEGSTVSREPDTNESAAPTYFTLKKITYPTGGHTEYEYEHGKYKEPGGGGPMRYAGIRIKTIKSFTSATSTPLVKTYSYGEDENQYGVPHVYIANPEVLFVKETTTPFFTASTPTGKFIRRNITYSTQMLGDVGPAFSQSGFVKYTTVTEYQSEYPSTSIGKTVYQFDVGHVFDIGVLQIRNNMYSVYQQGSPYYVYRYRPWDKPELHRKVSYSYSGGTFNPIHEEIFDFEPDYTTYTGLKVEQVVSNAENVINNESYGSTPGQPGDIFERYFNYGEYYIEIGKNTLKKKTEHNYLNGQTLTTIRTYDYSNLLPAKETMTNSTNSTVVTYTTYPKDYAAGTAFINDMVTNNLVAYPIEQVKYVEEGSNKKILVGQITTYKSGGKGLKQSELALENASPIASGSFKFSNRAMGQVPPLNGTASAFAADNNYKSRITYDSYDSKGNLLSATNDGGLSTSYVWGYNKTFPVAKVDNAKYDASGVDNSSGTPVYARVNEVLHENFEEHPLRLSIAGTHTGAAIFRGYYQVELKDKIPGSYKLVYWSSTDAVTWTKNEEIVQVTTSSDTKQIGFGAAYYVDDVRFYPTRAQMTTYTYDPLIGMTSQTDAAGVTTFYEYDTYGRLKEVKDDKKNILKQMQYHYKE